MGIFRFSMCVSNQHKFCYVYPKLNLIRMLWKSLRLFFFYFKKNSVTNPDTDTLKEYAYQSLCWFDTHIVSLSRSLSLSASFSLSFFHTHTHSLSHTHTHTHSLTHSLYHTHTLSLSLSLPPTHTNSLSRSHILSLAHTHPLSLVCTRARSLSISLSHTHSLFPTHRVSASAFAPICNPVQGAWGQKAFKGYLGSVEAGRQFQISAL